MYIPNLKSSADFVGAWDPSTSSLDWCESNYVWSFYIAEWWNTWSNLLMILPSLFGMWEMHRRKAEARFFWSFLALFAVGMGSWLFHMTLTYPMQLVDELSMLFAGATLLYCAFEINSEYDSANYLLVGLLAAITTGVSLAYILIGHPVFHQAAYALIVVCVVFRSLATLKDHPRYLRAFLLGMVVYVSGFGLWQVDVHFCHNLRSLRAGPAGLFPAVLQLHAWWHVMAGLCTYTHIVIMAATRSLVVKREMQVRFVLGFFPVLVSKAHAT